MLSDDLLVVHPENPLLKSSLLVVSSLFQDPESILSLGLVHLNLDHHLPQGQVGLVSSLLGFPRSLDLLRMDLLLQLQAVLQVLGLNLSGDEVGLHPPLDEFVLLLFKFGEFMVFSELSQFKLSALVGVGR